MSFEVAKALNDHMLSRVDGSNAKYLAKMACVCKDFSGNAEHLEVYKEAELLIGTMSDNDLHVLIGTQKDYIYKAVDVRWISRAFTCPGVLSDVFFVIERENPALYDSLTPDDISAMVPGGASLMMLLYRSNTLEKTTREWLETKFPEGFLKEMMNALIHIPNLPESWRTSVFPLGLWHYAKAYRPSANWIVWNVLEYTDDMDADVWDALEMKAEAMLAAS